MHLGQGNIAGLTRTSHAARVPPADSGIRQAMPREPNMDSDLDAMSREQLIDEVRRLRDGIRRHRDSSGHALCWHQPELWGLLPERSDPLPVVPAWPQFIAGCVRYRTSLDVQAADAPRSSVPFDEGDA